MDLEELYTLRDISGSKALASGCQLRVVRAKTRHATCYMPFTLVKLISFTVQMVKRSLYPEQHLEHAEESLGNKVFTESFC